MSLVTPERWYVVFWLAVGLVAVAPFWYIGYRIVSLLDEIRFILRMTR